MSLISSFCYQLVRYQTFLAMLQSHFSHRYSRLLQLQAHKRCCLLLDMTALREPCPYPMFSVLSIRFYSFFVLQLEVLISLLTQIHCQSCCKVGRMEFLLFFFSSSATLGSNLTIFLGENIELYNFNA